MSKLPSKLRALVGYSVHDATHKRGGMIGLFENGDPAGALTT